MLTKISETLTQCLEPTKLCFLKYKMLKKIKISSSTQGNEYKLGKQQGKKHLSMRKQ